MERASGRITAVHDDHLTVEVNTASFCSRCAAGKGCGAALLGADRGPRQVDVPLPRHGEFSAGDQVTLELAPQSVLHAALIVYGIPLATIAAIGVLALLFDWSDLKVTFGMIAGGLVGVTIGRSRLRRTNCLKQFTPVVSEPAGATR
ncbi:MAG: SoxR reducing system RseC family protein [Woeseiaceae bacterium]|nr:SoxR reducing system RseC family protein [Woeseiaceae bacterium]